MEMVLEKDSINVGDNILLDVELTNTCERDLVVSVVVIGEVRSYDGLPKDAKIPKHKEKVTVKANNGESSFYP